jgi:transposase
VRAVERWPAPWVWTALAGLVRPGTSRDDHRALTLAPHLEVSCLPCHRRSWNPSGSRSRRCCPPRQVHHPLGCHRSRIPDRIVFDKLVQILVFGCGYRRIADATCSATTLRRRRDEWISAGVAEQLRRAVLAAYDRLFGLELEQLAADGCITKAPCGGQVAGPSPVDRRKREPETLGRDRGVRDPADRGARPGQPPRHRAAGATWSGTPLPQDQTHKLRR